MDEPELSATLAPANISRLRDVEGRTVYRASLSSESAIEDWPGAPPNVLVHDASAVELPAALPLLDSHRLRDGVGVVLGRIRNLRIEARRLVGDITFSKANPLAQIAKGLVDDGTLTDMSLTAAPITTERVEISGHTVRRWTKWRPIEASIVGIGADQSVGIGRSLTNHDAEAGDEEDMTTKSGSIERHRATYIAERGAMANLSNLAMHAIRNGWSVTEFDAVAAERKAAGAQDGTFRVARMLELLGERQQMVDGYEAEHLQELARREGRTYSGEFFVPFSELISRDLVSNVSTAGGFLAGTLGVQPVEHVLRRASRLVQAGVRVVPNVVSAQTLPIVYDDNIAVAWQTDETTAATPSTPLLRASSGVAKVAIGIVKYGRRFAKQAADPEAFARELLSRVAGRIFDRAILMGSGILGEPKGVPLWDGVGAVTGASLDFADVVGMKADAALAGADDSSIAFFGHPEVREVLETRPAASGNGGFIWSANQVASVPAHATLDVASGGLICGPWSSVVTLLFNSGVTIELNPFASSDFAAGIVSARVIVDMDVLVAHPTAFTYASSIT